LYISGFARTVERNYFAVQNSRVFRWVDTHWHHTIMKSGLMKSQLQDLSEENRFKNDFCCLCSPNGAECAISKPETMYLIEVLCWVS